MQRRIAASLAAAALVSGCTSIPADHTIVSEGSFPGHTVWIDGKVQTTRIPPAATVVEEPGSTLTVGSFPGHSVWGARFPQAAQPDGPPVAAFPPTVVWQSTPATREEKAVANR
jgi:hypothetical protein